MVGDIDVEFLDLKSMSREAVLARVQIRVGMRFSQQLVDRSIRTLYATRLFEFIEARTESMGDNNVRVVFSVKSHYRIENILVEGAKEVSRRRLFKDVESRVGGILDERRLRADAEEMLTVYKDKGFTNATVDFRVDRNAETGKGVVTFVIEEGPRLKIKKVNFVGNAEFSSRKLRKEMKTRRRWWLSWLTGSGRFDEVQFQEDLENLRVLYLNEGYLDVSIPESDVTLDYPKRHHIVLTIRIDEGRQYHVGNISFEGNKLFQTLALYPYLTLIPGDVFSPETLNEDVEQLQNLYGSLGYLDTVIRPERRANIETGNIDLVYRITEGERFDVETIVIEGNTKTKSTVIIRELALAPGRNFNLVYMKVDESRLKNTRFFEDVKLQDEPTDVPGKRNLKIQVQEGRTGNLQFGAGFSTLERVVVFFEVSQSNFDLFKWRSPYLQGDGQKFRLRGEIGSRSNQISLYFEEPWLFETRLAGGFELYRKESDYNSAVYDELRTGIELFLRKRLFELVDAQLAYTFEIVDLDVGPSAPILIQIEGDESPRTTSKVDLTLVRDTRNDYIFTTRGSRFSFGVTFAGLGGDTEYMKFESRNTLFIPTFETGDQVLQIIARAGSYWSFGEKRNPVTDINLGENYAPDVSGSVPFYDKFYLGGPRSLRGFEYRDVSPVTQDVTFTDAGLSQRAGEPVGGNSYAYSTFEYTFKVADPLRFALFYDWGFVNLDDFSFDPSSYNDNWGFGIRLLVLGNPLRLDYGIPITSRTVYDENGNLVPEASNDRGGQFNFSFGTNF